MKKRIIFVITKESEYNMSSINKIKSKLEEYSSANVNHLEIDDLKKLMKKLKWVI